MTVAEILRAELGASGAYRVGGEEFAVIMAGRFEREAYAEVERLHRRLSQTAFVHDEQVSVSVGIAAFPRTAPIATSCSRWSTPRSTGPRITARTARASTPRRWCACTRPPSSPRPPSATPACARPKGLIRVVDAKDTYAGQHSQSVSRLVEGIAQAMALDEEVVDQMRLAGLLHDLGKIAIPDAILQKPGRLDPEELRTMREHADLGYRLLEGLGVSPVDRWIRHHHEWWDGSGYPLGLAGEEIPLGSRIILVADAFDAMTSDRCLPRRGDRAGRAGRAAQPLLDAVRRARGECAGDLPGSEMCHLEHVELRSPPAADEQPQAEAA